MTDEIENEYPEYSDIGPAPQPFNPFTEPTALELGDSVQARRLYDDGTVVGTEGYVTALNGQLVTVGPLVLDAEEGWTFEVIRRAVALPSKLSEIDAIITTSTVPVRLMGKGLVWTDENGVKINATDIRSFTVVE